MKHRTLKLILIALSALIVGAIIYTLTQQSSFFGGGSNQWHSSVDYPTTPITLTYWLPEEERGNLDEVLADYKKSHPNVVIEVEYIDPTQYQTRLLSAKASGTLPDIFAFRNDGLPLYKSALAPAPTTVFTPQSFTNTFVSLPTSQLVEGNNIYGVPFGLATLGLIYNKQTFASKNLQPSADWNEFVKLNESLRQKAGENLYASGVALGTSTIRNYPDIISVLMMQNGARMTNTPPTKATFDLADQAGYSPGAKALEFYAGFAQPARQNYSWSDSLGGSQEAFASGKTQLVIDYPMAVKAIARQNQSLQIGLASLPQLNADTPLNYGMYFTHAVSSTSQNTEIAWDFLGFATSAPEQRKYSIASFWPTSRKDLVREQQADKDLGPFARQIATAADWYKGVNSATNADLREMLTGYLSGLDSRIVVRNAASAVTGEIQKSQQP